MIDSKNCKRLTSQLLYFLNLTRPAFKSNLTLWTGVCLNLQFIRAILLVYYTINKRLGGVSTTSPPRPSVYSGPGVKSRKYGNKLKTTCSETSSNTRRFLTWPTNFYSRDKEVDFISSLTSTGAVKQYFLMNTSELENLFYFSDRFLLITQTSSGSITRQS